MELTISVPDNRLDVHGANKPRNAQDEIVQAQNHWKDEPSGRSGASEQIHVLGCQILTQNEARVDLVFYGPVLDIG